MINKTWILLAGIILVACIARFWAIGAIPPSLNWDEASWGYNAYTLGIDGKDEFGVFLPYKYLESYGDFKPPLYAYLAIIPVKIFGLTEFAVRFPSAMFGVLTVLITYYLVRELLYSRREADKKGIEWTALAASFILAVSPWHIMLSRAAFEANVASFLIICGIFLFLRAVNRQPWLLVLSAVSFALSFYTFNTTRIVAPLLVLVLAGASWKMLWKNKVQSAAAAFAGALIVVPIVPFLLSPEANLRFREVNIFSDVKIVEEANQKIANDNNAWWSKIINNRRVGYTQAYLSHYLDHFDPQFLFISGDVNPRFSIQDVGQMYVWDIPFLLLGILFLFKKRAGRWWWFIPVWFLIGIIPAATARETPHALRIETVLPTLQIVSAYGFITLLFYFQKRRTVIASVFTGLLVLNVGYFAYSYFSHYAQEYSGEWQYGYKQAAAYVAAHQNEYDTIYMTTHMGRPYIYFLLHNTVDPHVFRQTAAISRDAFGFVSVDGFQNLKFAKVLPHSQSKNNLYINTPGGVPDEAAIKETITQLNGETVLVVYTL